MLAAGNFFGALVLIGGAVGTYATEFNYHEQARWYDRYEECSMQRQSPIELNSMDAIVVEDMPEISFELYDVPITLPAKCENNGLTINIQLPKPNDGSDDGGNLWQIYDKLLPQITGGPFGAAALTYIADSIHFHWGSRDAHGSEHVIDSQRFAMEMHIVHRNSNYSSLAQASGHIDGLAVIAVLFKVQPKLHVDFLGLNRILTALERVAKFNETVEITNLTLSTLFETLDTDEFFTYAGSLTTPPCSQAVTWLIFPQAIEISVEQMSRFRHISDAYDAIMENNYRALQPKGNRRVYKRQNAVETTTDNYDETSTIDEIGL